MSSSVRSRDAPLHVYPVRVRVEHEQAGRVQPRATTAHHAARLRQHSLERQLGVEHLVPVCLLEAVLRDRLAPAEAQRPHASLGALVYQRPAGGDVVARRRRAGGGGGR